MISRLALLILDKSVSFISAEETLDLRSRVLRPGQPLQNCLYTEDHHTSTFHLAIKNQQCIICNGTFIQQGHELFPQAKQAYRLRGMATDFTYQKQGLGSILIRYATTYLIQNQCDLLWFNARISAEAFYQKLGFEAIDLIFDIPSVGPHKVMYKWLKSS